VKSLITIAVALVMVTIASAQAIPPAPEVVALQKEVAELKVQVAEIKALLTVQVSAKTAAPACNCGTTCSPAYCAKEPTCPNGVCLTPQTTVFASSGTICGPNGCQAVEQHDATAGYYAAPQGYSGGSCANGSCGATSGSGRRGLFGRCRR
jgi:type II secretory pathway pseudopilin PulG